MNKTFFVDEKTLNTCKKYKLFNIKIHNTKKTQTENFIRRIAKNLFDLKLKSILKITLILQSLASSIILESFTGNRDNRMWAD